VDEESDLREQLRTGDIDALIIIPERFGEEGPVSTVRAVFDSRKPSERGIAETVMSDVLDSLFSELARVPDEFKVESRFTVEPGFIEGKGEGFLGFLVPGVASMAIMQAGIFGVVFTLIHFKTGGVLRRLQATPIGPSHFLIGQVTTRLIVTVLQTYVLLLAGMLALGVSIGNGTIVNWIDLTILAVFGGALFTMLGLAISSCAKTEEVAAPERNIVHSVDDVPLWRVLPRTRAPSVAGERVAFFPLTYLADGLREITVNGASITTLGPKLLGLGIWTAFAVAARVFLWE
jgi:ABC-2 type transport system permease protein